MTSKRPYRDATSKEYAISELIKYKGTQFREDLVDVFLKGLDELDESELIFDMPEVYKETEHTEHIPEETFVETLRAEEQGAAS